jgi:hypothetical protein
MVTISSEKESTIKMSQRQDGKPMRINKALQGGRGAFGRVRHENLRNGDSRMTTRSSKNALTFIRIGMWRTSPPGVVNSKSSKKVEKVWWI